MTPTPGTDAPLQITAVLFPGFELLDVFGPLEMFGLLGDRAKITMAAVDPAPVASGAGPQAMPDVVLSEIETTDILLIPGGPGTRSLVFDQGFLKVLSRSAKKATIVASVCTGSALLAKAGLLDGHRATSNKLAYIWATAQSPKVFWQPQARWVVDGNFWTSSGIAAGIDMTLALIANLFDTKTATEIANRAEYFWNQNPDSDPFALS
ncbi:MAG: DJ-1/PfpI family protein [Terrimicrobiaceae bacterium]